MQLFGPPNVEKLKDKRDIPGLIKALAYQKDPTVRKAAVDALGEMGDARAVEPLIAVLRDEAWQMCQAAAEALGKIGDARAVESLINACKDGHSQVRRAATEALGKIGARAVEPLIAALKGFDPDVRQAAAEALGKIGAPAVAPLIAALRDRDAAVRQVASEALGKIGAPAVAPLIAALKDEDADVRKVAGEALGKIGAPGVEPLTAALKNEDAVVRRNAAEALGAIGDARAVEPLMAALKDEDSTVCLAAAEALDKIGWRPDRGQAGAAYWVAKRRWNECIAIGAPAVEPLSAVLDSLLPHVRDRAIEALGKIGDPGAVERLSVALNHKDADVRQAAARALDKLGWQPDQGAAGAGYWIARKQWDRCIQIGAPAVEPLITVVKAGWPVTHYFSRKDKDADMLLLGATSALGKIGDARAVEPLIPLLQAKDEDVRQAAARALGQIGDARAVEPLIAALHAGSIFESAYAGMCRVAAGALGQIGDARAVEPLILLLKSSAWTIRKTAAEALVALYLSGRLDEEHRQLVLAQGPTMTQGHDDGSYTIEVPSDCNQRHGDTGIGVDFPV